MSTRFWIGAAWFAMAACGSPPTKSGETEAATANTPRTPDVPVVEDTDVSCIDDAAFFEASGGPLLQAECATCHTATGPASGTRFVLDADASTEDQLTMLQDLVAAITPEAVLARPTGQASHGGGLRFDVLDPRYDVLHELVYRANAPGGCERPVPAPLTCRDGAIHPGATPLRRLTDQQFAQLVADTFDITLPDGLFPSTPLGGGFRTDAIRNGVSDAGAESILNAAEFVADALSVDDLLACGESPDDCARAALADWATRAWRRTPSDAELSILTRFIDAGVGAEDGLRMGVFVLLQTPQTVYLHSEADSPTTTDNALPVYRLHADAVADRLSFFLTDGPPDESLRAAAAAGRLSSRAEVAVEAQRLLDDPRTARVVSRFHEDWLDIHILRTMSKDTSVYPGWSPELVDDIIAETNLFTTEVVWMGDATLDALLFDHTTWVTPALADIYEQDTAEDGWQRVSLDPTQRPGILSRTAFLASHAYAATSAPVRRGAWVLEALLCEDLTPPPGINTTLPEESAEIRTIRDKLAAHAADPACQSCHVRIDPIGFSMENYDGIGAWRDNWESGIPVDASGSLESPAGDFVGLAEMISLVGTSSRARGCYARRWFEYAVGRPAGPGDACTLATLASRFDESGGDIRSLLVDITLTDAFLYRTETGEDPWDTSSAGATDESE